jgi:hypothetical protein
MTTPAPIPQSRCFFAHIVFATDARPRATPEATANLLIEINEAALASGGRQEHRKISGLMESQKVRLAARIARSAANDYLKTQREFRKFPVQRFVDFNLTGTPTYISIRPPPAQVLPNDSKVWRLAETESEQLRTKPLPSPALTQDRGTDEVAGSAKQDSK